MTSLRSWRAASWTTAPAWNARPEPSAKRGGCYLQDVFVGGGEGDLLLPSVPSRSHRTTRTFPTSSLSLPMEDMQCAMSWSRVLGGRGSAGVDRRIKKTIGERGRRGEWQRLMSIRTHKNRSKHEHSYNIKDNHLKESRHETNKSTIHPAQSQ